MGEIARTTPLRLADAAALAFPNGGMTVSGLRRERDRGRLVTEFVAGKEYTTLDAIDRMRKLCRAQPRALVSTSSLPVATPRAASSPPLDGSSETAAKCSAQDAAKATLQALIKPSPTTSAPRTGRRETNVVSMRSRSRTS
ncbi:excisionase [Methylorubrum aminovorans]|uniref:excisionase n=1 Tax=Methylorubrum aminovorans TaxID=269069 RepID=UPI0024E18DF5|nr:excisionase [Methylorubrum aminovorans]